MKLDPRAVSGFLADPGATRLILLYGPDAGLVRQRGSDLVRQVAGALDDPFRVVELEREQLADLEGEVLTPSLSGGRKVVRVRDISDSGASHVQAALKSKGGALLILEAGELAVRSKLRLLAESAPEAVAIPCYLEQGVTLRAVIGELARDAGLSMEADALDYLTSRLGADRGVTFQEIAKLALYTAPEQTVSIETATAVIGDANAIEVEDAIMAAIDGQPNRADRAVGRALEDGANPVRILRALLIEFQRIGRIRILMAAGASPMMAVRAARPPVFKRRQSAMTCAVVSWTERRLQPACQAVAQAEAACKQTGAPAASLCRDIVLAVARRAALYNAGH